MDGLEENLDAEVMVDLANLKEMAKRDLPPHLRCRVYPYLLGVASVDKSSEMTTSQSQDQGFSILTQRCITTSGAGGDGGGGSSNSNNNSHQGNSAAVRFYQESLGLLPPRGSWFGSLLSQSEHRRSLFLQVVCALRITHTYDSADYLATALCMASVFETVFFTSSSDSRGGVERSSRGGGGSGGGSPSSGGGNTKNNNGGSSGSGGRSSGAAVHSSAQDVYYCTEALLSILSKNGNVLSSPTAFQREMSSFLSLFHQELEVLYLHFSQEAVNPFDWIPQMLKTLLGHLLHVDDVLKLWDYYLSFALEEKKFPALHPFVCLSILDRFSDQLLEMDSVQILIFLGSTRNARAAASSASASPQAAKGQHQQHQQRIMMSGGNGGLPPIDMDRTISHALRMREKHRQLLEAK